MTSSQRERAQEVVRRVADGEAGELGRDLLALFKAGADQGQRDARDARQASERVDRLDAEVWALAYVLGEIMDGRRVDDVVNDLPHEVRRRVIAVRHASSGLFGTPQDQFGRLPSPPPRASVMRERVRTVVVDQVARPDVLAVYEAALISEDVYLARVVQQEDE